MRSFQIICGFDLRFLLLFLISHEAFASLSSNSENPTPTLGFTLTSYQPGQLDRECEGRLTIAKKKGFTGVSLVPSVELFPATLTRPVRMGKASWNSGEIARCLTIAIEKDFEIVFKPHLDVKSNYPRGLVRFRPDQHYKELLFREFMDWVKLNSNKIKSNSHGPIRVVISAEQEMSHLLYPSQWAEVAKEMRDEIQKQTLADSIELGFNPASIRFHFTSSCQAITHFLKQLDFIAPSIYPNWSKTHLGVPEVARRLDREIKKQMKMRSLLGARCDSAEHELKRLKKIVGEIGVGPSLKRSIYWGRGIESLPKDERRLARYRQKRRELYQNFVNYFKGNNPWHAWYIWTNNIHDPVGVSGFRPDGTAPDVYDDSEITRLFQSY